MPVAQHNNFNSFQPDVQFLFITNNTESNVSAVFALNTEQNETAGSDKLGRKNVQSVTVGGLCTTLIL